MDMFLPLFPMKSVMVFGLDESDLGDDVRAVAQPRWASASRAIREPLRNRFIRSDQYSFIRQGVPALALKVGYAPDSPDAEDRTRRGRRSATTRRPTTCSSRSTAPPPSGSPR